jgi:hypothetical protein
MALEKGAAVGKDWEINPRSLDTALRGMYKGEYLRGRGANNEATQKVFDTVRLGNLLNDGIPNSGTATRMDKGLLDGAIDTFVRGPTVESYMAMPSLFSLFDPMGSMGRSAAYRAGRATSDDTEELQEKVDNILGAK